VHAFMIPETVCANLGPAMAEKLAEAATMCRRARMGLVLPDAGKMPQLPPINGGVRSSTGWCG
jgi:hypothetical protein